MRCSWKCRPFEIKLPGHGSFLYSRQLRRPFDIKGGTPGRTGCWQYFTNRSLPIRTHIIMDFNLSNKTKIFPIKSIFPAIQMRTAHVVWSSWVNAPTWVWPTDLTEQICAPKRLLMEKVAAVDGESESNNDETRWRETEEAKAKRPPKLSADRSSSLKSNQNRTFYLYVKIYQRAERERTQELLCLFIFFVFFRCPSIRCILYLTSRSPLLPCTNAPSNLSSSKCGHWPISFSFYRGIRGPPRE